MDFEEIEKLINEKKDVLAQIKKTYGSNFVDISNFGGIEVTKTIKNIQFPLEKDLYLVKDSNGNVHIIAGDMNHIGDIQNGRYVPAKEYLGNEIINEQIEKLIKLRDQEKEKQQEDEEEFFEKTQTNIKDFEKNQNNEEIKQVEYIGKQKLIGDVKNLNIIQKIDPSIDMEANYSLAKLLGLPPEVENLAIVDTTNVNDKTKENITMKHSVVGITKNGQVIDLSNLIEQDTSKAITGDDNSLQINENDTAHFDNSVLSKFRVKSKNLTFAYGKDEAGVSQVFLGRKTKDNKDIYGEIETNYTSRSSKAQRDINAGYKGSYNSDKMQDEAKEHVLDGYEENLKNVDGDKKTKEACHHDEKTYLNSLKVDSQVNYSNLQSKDISLKFIKDNIEEFNKVKDQVKDPDLKRNIEICKVHKDKNIDLDLREFKEQCDNEKALKISKAKGLSYVEHLEKTADNVKEQEKERDKDERTLASDALKRHGIN